MPDQPVTDSEPEWTDAERLSVVWNRYVCGDDAADAALDPVDIAMLERLNALAQHPRPRRVFVGHLKQQLMDWPATKALSNTVAPTSPHLATNTRDHTSTGRDSRWWDGPRQAFGTVATLALIIVSLIGTYLAIAPPYGESGQLATAPMLAASTPDASPEACVGDCSDPSTAFSSVRPVATGFINKPDLSSDDLAATLVQFQDWAIDPGAMIEVPTANGAVTGAVVDIVLAGGAEVTIEGPAVVNRKSDPETAGVQYLPPGTTIELGRGDMISYPAGRARTILNPLSTTLLHFKSAVFYDGDPALTRPNPLPDNLHVRVDGNGVLPYSLARYPNNEVAVQLDYVQLLPDASAPRERWGNDRIIGPVDPQAGPAGQEGYILWVGRVMA